MRRNRIREYREARGMSQAELAKRLGVNQTMISAYEQGVKAPRLHRLDALTALFGCTMDDLYPKQQP